MRTLSKCLLWSVLALLSAALLLLVLAIESAPRVEARDDVSPANVDRAVALVRRHDPRRSLPGELRQVSLRERDLDLLVGHAARRWLGANTRLQLTPGLLLAQASVAAPYGRWLNIELRLRPATPLPEVVQLRVGRLPLPAALAIPLLRWFATRHGVQVDSLLGIEGIERIVFDQDQVTLNYRVGRETANRLRAALVTPADQQRLRAYSDRLAALTHGVAGDQVALPHLLAPLLGLAAERSAGGGEAVAENRAALLVLTFFANQRPLGLMVKAAYDWPPPRPLVVTLQQRNDFALHFLVSAVIAAEAGSPLADAVGLWKELSDARSGSGFSFNDLAADRAGTRFGELAVRDPARLQARIGAGAAETDFMPDASDLPEFLPEAEFVARYGGVGAAAYKRMLADIELRIDALPLLR